MNLKYFDVTDGQTEKIFRLWSIGLCLVEGTAIGWKLLPSGIMKMEAVYTFETLVVNHQRTL